MTDEAQNRLLSRAASASAALVAVLAATALVGWALDVEALRRPVPSISGMSPVTAGMVLALAAAVALAGRPGEAAGRGARALAAVAGAAALAGVVEQVSGVDLGPAWEAGVHVALSTAVALVPLAAGTWAVAAPAAPRRAARACLLVAVALGAAAIAGFVLGVDWFYGDDRRVLMAPQSAVCVVLLGFAAAALRPGPRLRVLVAPTSGGRFARTFLPLIAVTQIVIAVLVAAGARSDLFPLSTAVWLMAVASIGSLLALGLWSALRMHAEDLRTAEHTRVLERLALRDPLTGGFNRRAFDAEVARAVDHARRHGDAGAVAVIDLDHFKEINDRYGHAAGDIALVRVYRALRGRLRSTDVLGRIGGDEFAALLPHTDEASAERVARELALVVERTSAELEAEGRPNRLRASVGVAVMTGDRRADELLAEADERMYAVKRAARAA